MYPSSLNTCSTQRVGTLEEPPRGSHGARHSLSCKHNVIRQCPTQLSTANIQKSIVHAQGEQRQPRAVERRHKPNTPQLFVPHSNPAGTGMLASPAFNWCCMCHHCSKPDLNTRTRLANRILRCIHDSYNSKQAHCMWLCFFHNSNCCKTALCSCISSANCTTLVPPYTLAPLVTCLCASAVVHLQQASSVYAEAAPSWIAACVQC